MTNGSQLIVNWFLIPPNYHCFSVLSRATSCGFSVYSTCCLWPHTNHSFYFCKSIPDLVYWRPPPLGIVTRNHILPPFAGLIVLETFFYPWKPLNPLILTLISICLSHCNFQQSLWVVANTMCFVVIAIYSLYSKKCFHIATFSTSHSIKFCKKCFQVKLIN